MSCADCRSLSRSMSEGENLSNSGEQNIFKDVLSVDHHGIRMHRDFNRRFKSESDLYILARPTIEPFHSEPARTFPISKHSLTGNKICSYVDLVQNLLEIGSELSIGDVFQLRSSEPQSHRDPVVVFWEKSEKQENVESDIIVKFTLPGGEVFTQSFSKISTVEEIKRSIAEMFRVPFSILQLNHSGNSLQDSLCIADVAIERYWSVTFQLSSMDPVRHPLILNHVYPDIPTNDILTVIVHKGHHVKEVIVEIENRAISKPFLGGYRHKLSKLEYHHAYTQTAPKPCRENIVSRDTQTPGVCKMVETSRDKVTQTGQIATEFRDDKVVIGDPERRLIKLDQESKALQEKVLLIQRNLRSWLVRKMMMKMKKEYRSCILWEKTQKLKIEEEKEAGRKQKEEALLKPESRDDFELLYHNVEEWRRAEADRIKNMASIALRKSELFSLLETEIQYINSIERQRIQLRNKQQRIAQERLLEKAASPVKWKGTSGEVHCMESLGTQKARNFMKLYHSLHNVSASQEQRIMILREAKKTLLEYENPLVSELVSLLDRDHYILQRDLKQINLDSLRDRINYLFLEIIKDPKVNPEAWKYLPQNKYLKTQMYKCHSCQNIVPYYKFSLHSKANCYRKCHNCCWLREIGGPRIDVNPIRHIFNAVRREEIKQSSYTSIALIMQEQDYYHLIINIWLGHSAIGGCGNLEELRLGRWDYTQSWSPWNCILLTAEELKAHLRFPNPDQIYSPSFVKKIKQRHQMGRIYFSELAAHAVVRLSKNGKMNKMIKNLKAAKAHLEKADVAPKH